MKLSIVIPAYDEESAIGSTIERCLAARETIARESCIDHVEIIVVSDGSTDRTVEIASTYDEIKLIVFERNRGYGAAIKRGFDEGSGELVGFLDADGTCDPAFFGDLCRALAEENASVAIGSRLGAQSRMPAVRRLGNRVYALILSALSNKSVSDTASGMRVIRRDVLCKLYPLPDGLHFTPAMSARVLMDDELSIVERPMSYEDRVGESKLSVFRDGIRFLRTILEMTLMWQPARLFVQGAVACLGLMLILAAHPVEQWVTTGRFDEDLIYRLLFCSVLGSIGVMLLSAGVIADGLHALVSARSRPKSFRWKLLHKLYSPAGNLAIASLALPAVAWLVGEGIVTRITGGYVGIHWSRVVLAGLIAVSFAQTVVSSLIVNILGFHARRRGGSRTRPVTVAATTLSVPGRLSKSAELGTVNTPQAG